MSAKTKKCTRCERRPRLEDFPKDSRRVDGRGSTCRECHVEMTREWKEQNRSRTLEWQRSYDQQPAVKARRRKRERGRDAA